MAYDYGSNTLGIKNPFKQEGTLRSIAGVVIALLGIYNLIVISTDIQHDLQLAWVKAAMGLFFLSWGLKTLGSGLFQLFKYFVGRSVPASLAVNRNPSEKDNAANEAKFVEYKADDIESMLMGRKNTTFKEPIGWLARLIHSLLPKLILMPVPIRNLVQELGGLLSSLIIALTAYALAYFIANSGLIGSTGNLITPLLSTLLLIYITFSWRASAKSLDASYNRKLQSKSAAGVAKILSLAIILPVAAGYYFTHINKNMAHQIEQTLQLFFPFDAWINLLILFVLIATMLITVGFLVNERFKLSDPQTDVVEYRDNVQESVHPNELFINIENIVLANRRYKEIPNRVYQAFDPELEEQSQGKGSFRGKLLIETQPELQPIHYSSLFKGFRFITTLLGVLLTIVAAFQLYFSLLKGYDLYNYFHQFNPIYSSKMDIVTQFGLQCASLAASAFTFFALFYGGKIMTQAAHLFWSEMHFNSLLMWMKTEGTYTESKISTGMAIHDSTRSENVVVRSSITPWLLTSRITTSTFATSGMRNLEMPRYILSLKKNESEMAQIVGEIKSFLRGRESIASITNGKDLGNAETIYQVNQTTRAHDALAEAEPQKRLEEAAAKQLRDSDPAPDEKDG